MRVGPRIGQKRWHAGGGAGMDDGITCVHSASPSTFYVLRCGAEGSRFHAIARNCCPAAQRNLPARIALDNPQHGRIRGRDDLAQGTRQCHRGAGNFAYTGLCFLRDAACPRGRTATRRTGTPMTHTPDKYSVLLARCQDLPAIPTAVAHPCDASSLGGALQAASLGLIVPLLIGPEARIRQVADANALDLGDSVLIDAPHSHAAAARAVAAIRAGEAELLMKGSLHTDELLHEVTASATGLRTGRRLSHVFAMDVPSYHKPLFITDAAVNIFPTLNDKADICRNAIDLLRVLGIECPKVAILSAVETVTDKLPSTIDAAALCMMSRRGQIEGGILDGPLAFDNAISREAAVTKGIVSEVAGDPDILLVPDLEAGNMLAKQLTFLAGAEAAGIVLGARVPIILTSRADSVRARIGSCAIAVLLAHARRTGQAPSKI
ncbi:phosphate acetyltransferase [Cupriavidus sp. UME77]|uniref:phosphate acetyltransferase n=1 Tax=Cupriavidus sp. UME77 TaxID=1862321 RepID=UPI00351C7B8D